MKKTVRYIFAALFLLSGYIADCQSFYDSYYRKTETDTSGNRKISLHIYNNNFLRNNEYFGPYTEGITYIGSIFQPELQLTLNKNISVSAGWYFRQFYGHDGFEQSLPVIKVKYTISPHTRLLFGQLEGQLRHGFIEPIYNTDNYFVKNPEYGIQFLVNRERLQTDFFMDWEKFLLPGEAHQEIITGGLLGSYRFGNTLTEKGLTLNIQSIIHHFGGQVDNSDNPLQTRANLVAGFAYAFLTETKALRKIVLSSSYLQALELSQTNTIPYESGFGMLNTITMENRWAKLSTGWFHGEYFFTPLGDYLFQSISQFNNWYVGEKRNLIISKFLIGEQIFEGVQFGIRFESYYDTERKSNDFSYGMNICLDTSVFEKILR